MRRISLMLLTAMAGYAQTQIDLRTQAKRVDFTAAEWTRPVKTGTMLPETCTVGDMFFKLEPPTGVYGCTAPNFWVVQGGGGTQNLTFKSDDVPVGTRGIANFQQGSGLITLTADTGTQINFQTEIDPAVVQTQAGHQSGVTLLCASAGASASAYTCSLSPALVSYSRGMVLNWIPDVNGAGGQTTVNVDSLGPVPVKTGDGASDPAAGDIVGGRMHTIWHDGSNFRLLAGGGSGGGGAVASVFGRTGTVMPQAGDYNTDLVSEGANNLYFTNARAQGAIANFTGDSGAGGTRGTVPAPAAGDAAAGKFLKATGGWASPPGLPKVSEASGDAIAWPFGPPWSVGGNNAMTSGGVQYFQFGLSGSYRISAYRLWLTVASAADKGIAVGLMDANCNLVAGSNASGVFTTTGLKSISLSAPITLNPGTYYLGLAAEAGSGAAYLSATTTTYGYAFINAEATPRMFTGANGPTGSGASLTLPAACGARTAYNGFPVMAGMYP